MTGPLENNDIMTRHNLLRVELSEQELNQIKSDGAEVGSYLLTAWHNLTLDPRNLTHEEFSLNIGLANKSFYLFNRFELDWKNSLSSPGSHEKFVKDLIACAESVVELFSKGRPVEAVLEEMTNLHQEISTLYEKKKIGKTGEGEYIITGAVRYTGEQYAQNGLSLDALRSLRDIIGRLNKQYIDQWEAERDLRFKAYIERTAAPSRPDIWTRLMRQSSEQILTDASVPKP